MPSFTVREFGVDEDLEEGMFTVGFAELPGGGGTHVIFTCSGDDFEDDEQDMDSYCITNDEGGCTYEAFPWPIGPMT